MAEKGKEKTVDDKSQKTAPAEERLEQKLDAKVEDTVDQGASKKEAVNIIGDITKPKDPENKKEVAEYFKEVNEKLDQLLAGGKKEEPPKIEPRVDVKKERWYDRQIF